MLWVTTGHQAWEPSLALQPLLPSLCSHKDVADQLVCVCGNEKVFVVLKCPKEPS